ncbi:PhnD/SsuA/transferrin family substrate-binding protein [Vibrio lentus]|nr:PhnD/SsuA/transferrin family substrate-binding protein [Vibrio lentus]
MRSGHLHIAGFNTGSTPLAVNCAGFAPFTMMAAEDGFPVTKWKSSTPGSGIEKVEDLKGKNLAFTSQTSNSGLKAPSPRFWMLNTSFNLSVISNRLSLNFAHDNSILGCSAQRLRRSSRRLLSVILNMLFT